MSKSATKPAARKPNTKAGSRKRPAAEPVVDLQAAAAPPVPEPQAEPVVEQPAPADATPEPQPETPAPEPRANGKPAKAPKVKAPKEKAPPPVCLCGCGATTGGGRFLTGHDAKLKSALLKAFRSGGLTPEQDALVERLDWGRFLTAAPASAPAATALERARAALARLTDAERAELLADYAVPVKRI